MNNETRDWITAAEAAVILDVHPRTVIRWAEDGAIRATKLPGRTGSWLLSRIDVEGLAEKASAS